MWPVYVINMDANTTRLARVSEELARAGVTWERLPAVNGRALSEAEMQAVYDIRANAARARHDLVGPEIGCYLSHIAAWRRLIESPHDGAVILEDDFRVTGDLAGWIAALAEDHAAGARWNLVKLFAFKPVRLIDARALPAGQIGMAATVPSTTLGYVITRAAAEALLAKVPPFFRPIDEDHKHFWEFGLRVAMVDPQPIAIGAQETVDGTVGESRKSNARKDPLLRRLWRFYSYRVNYRLQLTLARLGGL